MTTLFISDLHLDPSRPKVTRALLNFLEGEAAHCDALYVLGDLFEAWVGDDDDSEFNTQIVEALKVLTDSGVPVSIIRGNRDFLLGNRFAEQTGCQLLADIETVDLYGQSVLIMHGDSLCIDDKDYMAFRAQCRSEAWQAAMLAKPLQERRMIAEQMRMQSQQANSNKADAIMDVNSQEVVTTMRQHNSQLLIHGHTHRPDVHKLTTSLGESQRVVLGDWEDFGWVLRYQPDNQFQLDKFAIE